MEHGNGSGQWLYSFNVGSNCSSVKHFKAVTQLGTLYYNGAQTENNFAEDTWQSTETFLIVKTGSGGG